MVFASSCGGSGESDLQRCLVSSTSERELRGIDQGACIEDNETLVKALVAEAFTAFDSEVPSEGRTPWYYCIPNVSDPDADLDRKPRNVLAGSARVNAESHH